MTGPATLVVVGTGQLARAVCYALAGLPGPQLRIVVLGRNPERVAELCYVAATRAAATRTDRGEPVRFEPTTANLADEAALAAAMGTFLETTPSGVLLCASTQSPWERLTAPSAWTDLIQRAGFGITLPLQAELARRIAAATPPDSWLVNACFPDAVNPLLAACGTPVLCGVGNIGTLAASLQSALELPDQRRLQLLAHHVHLHDQPDPATEALAWLDGQRLSPIGALLAAQRSCARPELNHVTGLTAALLVRSLLSGTAELDTHLPGPLGLPGGYPVRVRTRAGGGVDLELRLPPGLTPAEAVASNQRWAAADGVVVDGDRVEFPDAARAELRQAAPGLSGGFTATELDAATNELRAARRRLRALPAGGPPATRHTPEPDHHETSPRTRPRTKDIT